MPSTFSMSNGDIRPRIFKRKENRKERGIRGIQSAIYLDLIFKHNCSIFEGISSKLMKILI